MSVSASFHRVTKVSFSAYRYKQVGHSVPGGWLNITVNVKGQIETSLIVLHTDSDELADHFQDIARALSGPLRAEQGAGDAAGETTLDQMRKALGLDSEEP